MKAEDDVLVLGEQRIVVGLAQPVRMLAGRLQLHQIDDVDHPDFQVGQMLPQDRHGRQNFQRRRVAATRHDDVGLAVLVVAGPLPDAKTLRAMYNCLLHGQPLR